MLQYNWLKTIEVLIINILQAKKFFLLRVCENYIAKSCFFIHLTFSSLLKIKTIKVV